MLEDENKRFHMQAYANISIFLTNYMLNYILFIQICFAYICLHLLADVGRCLQMQEDANICWKMQEDASICKQNSRNIPRKHSIIMNLKSVHRGIENEILMQNMRMRLLKIVMSIQ